MTDTRPYYTLQWHITHACNLRCVHCYQEEYRSHMPTERFRQILDEYEAYLEKIGMRGHINLTGGEPFLHPDFFPLCEEIRRRKIRFAILTNGTLIDDETAERLAQLHPQYVQVSLDGPREIHDAIRGEGNFDRALRGIDTLKAHGIQTTVSFTAQKGNYRSFAQLAPVCRKHDVNKLWWDRVVTETPADAERLALTTRQFFRMTLVSNFLHVFYRRRNGRPLVTVQRALQAYNCPRDGYYICGAGTYLVTVLADGSVMTCRRLPFVIGHIGEGTLTEIIENSPIVEELSRPRYPEGCEHCRRFPLCRGGSRCVTYGQTHDLHAKDVNCFYCRTGRDRRVK